jgi:polyisoprenyl-teichoic acid--peptidoglycan teichoic acid transferase
VNNEHGVNRVRVTGRRRLVVVIATVAVLVTAGLAVGVSIAVNRLDRAIPQTDLFGTPTDSASTDPSLSAAPETTTSPPAPPPGGDITGPLNILLAGHDMVPGAPDRVVPHADAVLILHIDASLTHAYLTSLPRDLLVDVPADEASGSGADYTKLTHAMTYGSRVPGSEDRDLAQGFALLARTVSNYTGIDHFDAGAVVSFSGMTRLVDVMGGIDVYVDADVTSIHLSPQGDDIWGSNGPFATYPQGMQHLEGWQALDYARQRYGVPGGAYGRERHICEVMLAMISKLSSFDLTRFSLTAPYLLASIGDTVTLDLRGRALHEYVYALRNLRPEAITLVSIPGGGVYDGGSYLGESLASIEGPYFESVRNDTVGEFLAANPDLINDPR